MRKLLGTLLLLAIGINAAQAAPGACATKAIAMLDALGHHDYATASQHMGASLQAPQQQKMLISMWEALIKNNWGPYQSHGEAETIASDDRATTIKLPLQFDHGSTTATITCNPKEGGAIDEFVLL